MTITTRYLKQTGTGYQCATYLFLEHPFIKDAYFCFYSRNCWCIIDYDAPTIQNGLLLVDFDSPRINPMPAKKYGSTLNSIRECYLFNNIKFQSMEIDMSQLKVYEEYINNNTKSGIK